MPSAYAATLLPKRSRARATTCVGVTLWLVQPRLPGARIVDAREPERRRPLGRGVDEHDGGIAADLGGVLDGELVVGVHGDAGNASSSMAAAKAGPSPSSPRPGLP